MNGDDHSVTVNNSSTGAWLILPLLACGTVLGSALTVTVQDIMRHSASDSVSDEFVSVGTENKEVLTSECRILVQSLQRLDGWAMHRGVLINDKAYLAVHHNGEVSTIESEWRGVRHYQHQPGVFTKYEKKVLRATYEDKRRALIVAHLQQK